MTIKQQVIEGKTYYGVYVFARSKTYPNFKVEKRRNKILTHAKAKQIENILKDECISKIRIKEGYGKTLAEIYEEWAKFENSGPIVTFHPMVTTF